MEDCESAADCIYVCLSLGSVRSAAKRQFPHFTALVMRVTSIPELLRKSRWSKARVLNILPRACGSYVERVQDVAYMFLLCAKSCRTYQMIQPFLFHSSSITFLACNPFVYNTSSCVGAERLSTDPSHTAMPNDSNDCVGNSKGGYLALSVLIRHGKIREVKSSCCGIFWDSLGTPQASRHDYGSAPLAVARPMYHCLLVATNELVHCSRN